MAFLTEKGFGAFPKRFNKFGAFVGTFRKFGDDMPVTGGENTTTPIYVTDPETGLPTIMASAVAARQGLVEIHPQMIDVITSGGWMARYPVDPASGLLVIPDPITGKPTLQPLSISSGSLGPSLESAQPSAMIPLPDSTGADVASPLPSKSSAAVSTMESPAPALPQDSGILQARLSSPIAIIITIGLILTFLLKRKTKK